MADNILKDVSAKVGEQAKFSAEVAGEAVGEWFIGKHDKITEKNENYRTLSRYNLYRINGVMQSPLYRVQL